MFLQLLVEVRNVQFNKQPFLRWVRLGCVRLG